MPALLVADSDYFKENAASPVQKRGPEEQAEIYTRYEKTLLTKAGIDVPESSDTFFKIMNRVRELSAGMSFVLFEDVLLTLKKLKELKLTLGLLTNLDRDMIPICHKLGLEPYLNFIVTSGEAGADKPNPAIFLSALQKARVDAEEAVHVGDQYQLEIIGARGVDITPILIDRYNLYPEVNDCPRIHSLTELTDHLK